MCVCACVHVHACVYVRACVYTCACACAYVRACACVHTCACVRACVRVHACVRVRVRNTLLLYPSFSCGGIKASSFDVTYLDLIQNPSRSSIHSLSKSRIRELKYLLCTRFHPGCWGTDFCPRMPLSITMVPATAQVSCTCVGLNHTHTHTRLEERRKKKSSW